IRFERDGASSRRTAGNRVWARASRPAKPCRAWSPRVFPEPAENGRTQHRANQAGPDRNEPGGILEPEDEGDECGEDDADQVADDESHQDIDHGVHAFSFPEARPCRAWSSDARKIQEPSRSRKVPLSGWNAFATPLSTLMKAYWAMKRTKSISVPISKPRLVFPSTAGIHITYGKNPRM